MNMENLQQKAADIRDERNPNENTAQRVGEVLVEMVKNIDTLDYKFKEQLDIQTEKVIELKRNISDIQNVIFTTKRRNVSVGGNDYNVQKTDDYNWSVQVKEISESAATYHICGIKIGTIAEITSPLHIYVSSKIAHEANFSTIGITWSPEYKIKGCPQNFEKGYCVFTITPEEITAYQARTGKGDTESVYLLMGSHSTVVRSTYVGKSCRIYATDTLHDKPDFEDGEIIDTMLSAHENSIVKLLSQMDKLYPKKNVVCYGDSLTAGSDAAYNNTTGTGPWVSVLKRLVGDDYEFLNRGVGGEDSATIAGRQGGVPFYLTSEIELPADTTPVELLKDTNESGKIIGLGIASECNGHIVYTRKILAQGGNINPVMIDGVECNIIPTIQSYTATSYKIARTSAASSTRKLLKGSFIYTNEMKTAKNADVAIIFIGQNGGYNNEHTLVEQVRKMVQFTNCGGNYIVISSHGNGNVNIQRAFGAAFGAHYINLQQYLPNHGIEDAIRFGLTTAEAMTGKVWDDGTLKNANDVHLTSLGNAVLGYRIFEIGKRIGIF